MQAPSAPSRRPRLRRLAALLAVPLAAACGAGLHGTWTSSSTHSLSGIDASLETRYGASGEVYHVSRSRLTVTAAARPRLDEWEFRLEVIQDLNASGRYEASHDQCLATGQEVTVSGGDALELPEARFRSRPELEPLLLRWVVVDADGREDDWVVPLQ